MPEGQVLEFSGVTKRFGAVTAVSDFSARVEPGLVTGFLGPNGAGKTTTPADPARAGPAPRAAPRRSAGAPYSPSSRRPLQTRRGRARGVELPPRTHGREPPEGLRAGGGASRSRASTRRSASSDSPMSAGRKVGGFSLGMRQRLGLAYALLGRSRRARAGRARERPRSRGHQVDARLPPPARARGPHSARVVAPARRGAADGRLAADHLAGPARVPGRARGPRRSVGVRDRRRLARSGGAERGAERRRCVVRGAPLRPDRARTRARRRSARSRQPPVSPCRRCSAAAPRSKRSSSIS